MVGVEVGFGFGFEVDVGFGVEVEFGFDVGFGVEVEFGFEVGFGFEVEFGFEVGFEVGVVEQTMKPTKAEVLRLAKELADDVMGFESWGVNMKTSKKTYLRNAAWILERFDRKPVHVTKTQLAKTRMSFLKTLDETAKAKKAKRKACK